MFQKWSNILHACSELYCLGCTFFTVQTISSLMQAPNYAHYIAPNKLFPLYCTPLTMSTILRQTNYSPILHEPNNSP